MDGGKIGGDYKKSPQKDVGEPMLDKNNCQVEAETAVNVCSLMKT